MKKIIFFVMWLSLVSRGSYSQTTLKKTISQASTYKASTTLTDTVFGQSGTNNAKWAVRDEVIAGDVSGTQGATFVNSLRNTPLSSTSPTTGQVMYFNGTNWGPFTLIKSTVGLSNVDNTSDVNKPVSTAQATAIALKQDALVSGANIKTINGASILGSGDIVISGSGGTTVHPYVDAVYSSTMNLDFNATNYSNITGVSSDLIFTSSNSSNGKSFGVVLNISTSSAINIYFTQANFGTPGLLSQTALAKPIQTSTPYSYNILAGSSGAKILLVFDYIASNQFVTAINLQNSDYPSSIRANNLNLRNFPAFADPGNTTAETVVYSHKIAANTLNDSSTLVIPYVYRRTSGSGVIQFKIRACPTASTTLSSCPTIEDFGQSSGFGDYRRTCILQNVNHSSNLTQLGYAENFGNFSTATSKSVDWSQDVYLKFSIEKQTSGTQVGGVGMIRINGEGL